MLFRSTTSGGWGHRCDTALGFAYVPAAYAAPESRFDVGLLGDRIEAQVLSEPLYDPENNRLRA